MQYQNLATMNKKLLLFTIVFSVLSVVSAFAQPVPRYRWASMSDDSSFNWNRSEVINAPLAFTVPYCHNYTVVAVYTSSDTAEQGVWTLDYGIDGTNRLTTRRLSYAASSMVYDSIGRLGPVINSLMQSSPIEDTLSAPDSVVLHIGGSRYADDTAGLSASASSTRMAEVLYFRGRLGFSALRKVQTHLAVKYGVTLGAGDYVSPTGRRLWRYSLDSAWHHRITGVGADSTCNLHQTKSRSGHEDSMLTLSADSLNEGMYLLIGDDGAPMEYTEDTAFGMYTIQRTWKARLTRDADTGNTEADNAGTAPADHFEPTFSLAYTIQGTQAEGDTLALVVDDDIYYPDSIGNGVVSFSGVTFPSDTAILQLMRASAPEMVQRTRQTTGTSHGTDPSIANSQYSVRLFPNPCKGSYMVSVDRCGTVDIEVHNNVGVKVDAFGGSGKNSYRFKGKVPSAGVYYITVNADGEKRTMKLVSE